MAVFISSVIFFGLVLTVRRKEAFQLRWHPTQHTWIAVGTGLLVFILSALLLPLKFNSLPGRLIHYGLIYVMCGAAIPWGYTVLVERSTPSALGVKRERWILSLTLGLLASVPFVPLLIFQGGLGAVGWAPVAKAAFVLTGAGGLFELFLYCGFIHLRLEKAFGIIPAILVTAAIYVLWHVGTQLQLEANPGAAMLKLFLVGVMFQSLFSLTRNLLIVWPFFHAVGVMIDFAVNIGEVELVSRSWPWAAGAVTLMAIIIVILTIVSCSSRDRIAT